MREEEMNCKEIRELLTAYLDGEVTPEEKAYIETHLPDCPRCQSDLKALSATRDNLRGVFQIIADEAAPSPQTWDKIRDRLESKESRRGFWASFTLGRVATAASAVVVLIIAVVIWQYGGFLGGMSSPPPAPAPTPAPIPAPAPAPSAPPLIEIPPMPAPQPPLEVRALPEEVSYLPRQDVEIEVSFTNISSETIILTPFPPELQVKPQEGDEVLYRTSIPSERAQMLLPGHEAGLVFTWDQKDKGGNQIPPGWYRLVLEELTLTQETTTMTHHLDSYTVSRFLIQYPQGAMEKTIEPKQSQTVNDITVTLQSIELNATRMIVYTFCAPPGYTSPQGILPTSRSMVASAEYSVDGGAIKEAGLAGFRFLEDGTRYTWKGLDPVPADAKELNFIITMRWEDKPEELLGPWEFVIPLE